MDDWKRLSFLPQRELRELQNNKLRSFISTQLYPFSPYYRKLFEQHKLKPQYIKTVKDLKLIPFTKKEDFFPNDENPSRFRDFILQPDESSIKKYQPKSKLIYPALLKILKGKEEVRERLSKEYRPIFLTATTGTTNQPVSFLYSRFDINNLYVSGYRLLDVFGVQKDSRGVNLFPYAPHLAFWQTVFAAFAYNVFMLSTGGGKVLGTLGNIEAILKVKPDILIGVPGYLYHLVRSARQMNKNLSFIKKIILGASAVPPGFKEKLSSMFVKMSSPVALASANQALPCRQAGTAFWTEDVQIIGTYGFTEAKCAWGECPTDIGVSSGYHTYPDKEIFEVIDPASGEVKGEGEDGELVYSSIDSRGSCVLRYRTGDLVKGGLVYSPCPYCKRTIPRISSSIYRASNIKNLQLSKVKGTLVNLNNFGAILEAEKGIEEWQIELRKKDNDPYEIDELLLYLSLTADVNQQILKDSLNAKFHSLTEITPNQIIILPHQEMLKQVEMEISHKVKRFVDKRP